VVEDVADTATGAFHDLSAAFGRANTGVLGSHASTFADVTHTFDGVEGDDIGRAFTGAFGDVASGGACSFADVARATADVAACAAGGWRRGRGGLLLSVSARSAYGCGGEYKE
jgi:hypothetical protein